MPTEVASEGAPEQTPSFPIINLGYCCLNSTLRERKPSVHTNRTCIKKTFVEKGLAHASRLALQNVTDLSEVIRWNEEHGIRLFRISSDMFPFWSEYALLTCQTIPPSPKPCASQVIWRASTTTV